MIIKGQKINDRYQIIRTIGEGGMANVYLAFDTILERNVAVKILRGDLADDEKFVRRFQREAISASSLSHTNIVEMYDVGEDDGKYFIVMEFVDGKTLKSLIKRRGALTVHEVIDIMLQLTSGIAHAHESYIIHRDIKPQNVMIIEDGTVKITDFGIAMALNSNELTQTNSVMGSVHYLPPEQANGTGSTIKSDIYSLGILMFELLTGKVPFKGDNAVEIAIKQMKDKIPSVCEINPDIPQSLENIILNACGKNPKNRYNSVLEMHEDLKTALDPERMYEEKVVYKYPEQDDIKQETPKKEGMGVFMKKGKKKTNNEQSKEISKAEKRINMAIIISSMILFVIASLFCIFLIIYPRLHEVKDIVIPDVKNMTLIDAEKILLDAGLRVNIDTIEKNSEQIKEGNVVGTKPEISKTVKAGTEITIIISTGSQKIEIEDYVGQNYYEVKAKLEEKGLLVTIDKKEVEDDKIKDNIILEQNIKAGTEVKKGSQIILIIPDKITQYPDFVGEEWTVEDIREFCKEYNINLTITTKETSEYPDGTVITQNRAPKSKVMANTTLKITVTKVPVVDDVLDNFEE